MDRETREGLRKAIIDYNKMQHDEGERVNMQDLLSEIGSLDNEEVEKATEILKSKTENGE